MAARPKDEREEAQVTGDADATSGGEQGGATQTIRFGGLDITFDSRVLRPRPWTEAQSRWAASLLDHAPAGGVLELCTGAGHIGLAAVAGTTRRLVAVDISSEAAAFARANARGAGLQDRVEVRTGEMGSVLGKTEQFALVIADPPWVRRERTGDFPDDPMLAIDGGDDGLDVARTCLGVIERHLMSGGSALIQLGSREQASALAAEVTARGVLTPGEVREYERGVLVRFDRAGG